jgi:hypothetical protein
MTQHRRAIAAFADGNALNDWQRSSKAQGGALISAAPHSSPIASNYYDISIAYGRSGRLGLPHCQPVRRPEILPLAIREVPEGAKAGGGSETIEGGEYRPVCQQRLSRRARALDWRRLRVL